ncbi:hypothetical protein P6144_03075 [Sphingomonas sp. HITSZ_GF]|uniref:hypothetical protein n=1 Tax=Sphingomonas sp. HITSZ_GF TaxID=3037247 RepID=UPI00240DDE71|nr:hypothetical protein [Sphingomonas sp. HITSZ_GF]MDG2532618.1 hypothetical protein [Sphingomonas sp. HITSZ_GF]
MAELSIPSRRYKLDIRIFSKHMPPPNGPGIDILQAILLIFNSIFDQPGIDLR